jgi:hypothetical protein
MTTLRIIGGCIVEGLVSPDNFASFSRQTE